MTKREIEDELINNPDLIPTALATIGRIMMTTSEHIGTYDKGEEVRWFTLGAKLNDIARLIMDYLREQGRY